MATIVLTRSTGLESRRYAFILPKPGIEDSGCCRQQQRQYADEQIINLNFFQLVNLDRALPGRKDVLLHR